MPAKKVKKKITTPPKKKKAIDKVDIQKLKIRDYVLTVFRDKKRLVYKIERIKKIDRERADGSTPIEFRDYNHANFSRNGIAEEESDGFRILRKL